MKVRATPGWVIGIIVLAIVGAVTFFLMGSTFGGTVVSGVISALIFLTILIGFVILNFRESKDEPQEDDDDI